MSLNVRLADKNDMDSLLSLMGYLLSIDGDFPQNKDDQRRGFQMVIDSDSAWMFVAELDGKVVGMCHLYKYISTVQGGYVGMVEDVVIDKSASGKGIGLKMFEFLEGFAKEQGLSRLQLMVSKDNTPAISFYKKQDWQVTDFIGCLKPLGRQGRQP